MKTFFEMCEHLCPNQQAYEEILELFSKNTHIGNLRKAERIRNMYCSNVALRILRNFPHNTSF